MSIVSNEDVPEPLESVRTRPLFRQREQVPPLYVVGKAPNAFRRIGVVTGGSFAGERLSGEVLSGGNDWQSVRSDLCTKLDVRLVLRTKDGALIVMTYQVLRHGRQRLCRARSRRGRRSGTLLVPFERSVRHRHATV